LNADGEDVKVKALDGAGVVVGEARLTSEKAGGVYRKLAWSGSTSGIAEVRVTLGEGCKLYSLGYGD
jgi:hypothetical protein